MRDLIQQVIEAYGSPKLEGQEEGTILFSGQEPDTKQRVWIKIPARLLGQDPRIAARFRTLAQMIRQLNHPNIVPVRAVGEKAGLPYLVTRIVEKAQPLATRLGAVWDVDAAGDVVMQVGQALEHAYNKGLFHGSLSPQNILVQDNGQVKVADFGVSALLDLLGVKSKQPASAYLAPERLAGGAVDARVDVYSLAAILYYLLAQREPQIVKGQVLPPSRFNTDVPGALDEVVVKALAPDPQDRYPNIKAFLVALGAVVLVPAGAKAQATVAGSVCPKCGTENKGGRFCRKCGARLDRPAQQAAPLSAQAPRPPVRSRLDEPIQVTKVSVGEVKLGKGVEVRETIIATPMAVATSELASLFPQPLEMPRVDLQALGVGGGAQATIRMPEPLPMPVIEWAKATPPLPEAPIVETVDAEQKRTN